MGNSLECSASSERLVSVARDGDLIEACMLLEFNLGLVKYSTFRGLNSPLHFATAKGHNEIVTLLLENGSDVNLRNYCGQDVDILVPYQRGGKIGLFDGAGVGKTGFIMELMINNIRKG
ncbi:hypothetical protein ZIOFF_012333 [Zingiber officinale]|uniref:Uncharacterized protein n=1 Tax=Zingiber officinale TaxID=94328 RepID=A0A8J5HZU9_ZINOF|nr:hypothetical protein ZIOFF_012333 [Zingiber officinale]